MFFETLEREFKVNQKHSLIDLIFYNLFILFFNLSSSATIPRTTAIVAGLASFFSFFLFSNLDIQ